MRVLANDPSEVVAPDQAMRWGYHLDFQGTKFLDGFQGLHGHLADYVGVIAAHVILIESEVHLVVKDAAIQGTEATKGIVAEDYFAVLLVGHHRLGPVHHRHHEEL